MKIHAIIPARSGSKGIKDKNIKLLNDKPLIAYSIEDALKSDKINKVWFTSDSQDYIDIAKEYKAECILRPKHLSDDFSADVDYLLHFIFTQEISIDDYIVLLRPTTPLKDVKIINKAITTFLKSKKECQAINSLRSIHQINESPEKMYRIIPHRSLSDTLKPYMGNTHEEANKPRQCFDQCYSPNGYIDIMSVSSIIRRKITYGNIVIPFVTDKVIEIDSQDDFDYVEFLISKRK